MKIFIKTLCLLVAVSAAIAEFMLPPLENVPIERLIANVQEKIRVNPNDKQWHYTLGRLYSMAATGAAKMPAKKEDQMPFFSPEPQAGPMRHSVNAAKTPEAKKYLANAIESYQAALKLDTADLFSLMGLAWCYAQDDQKDNAIDTYRKAHDIAWKQESGKSGLYHGSSITAESGEALIQLAPNADNATIKQHITAINARPMMITPIIFPVEPSMHVSDLVDIAGKGVLFDLAGAGQQARWQWITPSAAFLVWDGDGNGIVKNGRQLFGSTTWWVIWHDGYQPLAALDDDGNGVLESNELHGLAVWHDRNANGISDPGEVISVFEWGITGIECRPALKANGFLSHPAGIRFSDGSSRPTYDWLLRKLS
jgi:hypothetical protein